MKTLRQAYDKLIHPDEDRVHWEIFLSTLVTCVGKSCYFHPVTTKFETKEIDEDNVDYLKGLLLDNGYDEDNIDEVLDPVISWDTVVDSNWKNGYHIHIDAPLKNGYIDEHTRDTFKPNDFRWTCNKAEITLKDLCEGVCRVKRIKNNWWTELIGGFIIKEGSPVDIRADVDYDIFPVAMKTIEEIHDLIIKDIEELITDFSFDEDEDDQLPEGTEWYDFLPTVVTEAGMHTALSRGALEPVFFPLEDGTFTFIVDILVNACESDGLTIDEKIVTNWNNLLSEIEWNTMVCDWEHIVLTTHPSLLDSGLYKETGYRDNMYSWEIYGTSSTGHITLKDLTEGVFRIKRYKDEWEDDCPQYFDKYTAKEKANGIYDKFGHWEMGGNVNKEYVGPEFDVTHVEVTF